MSSTITINGPVVPVDVNNEILRDALLHSPSARLPSESNYHLIEVGVREGAHTDWVGTWDQSTQKIAASTPTSILDLRRRNLRLKGGQAVVVRVTATGAPTSLRGSCVTLRMSLVGGRDGSAKALVSSGQFIDDPASRVAIANLERQVNKGGLAQWDESVQLLDPATIAGPALRLPYVTPSQITANTNDYAPNYFSAAAVLRLSSDAARNVTGIAGGTEGREVTLFNVGSFNIVLVNASVLSVAANRFSIGANFTLTPGGSCSIWYDAVTSTWRII